MQVESHRVWYFVTGLFHLALRFQDSSTMLHASVVHSFLWLKNVVLYEYITLCLVICSLLDIWVVSTC